MFSHAETIHTAEGDQSVDLPRKCVALCSISFKLAAQGTLNIQDKDADGTYETRYSIYADGDGAKVVDWASPLRIRSPNDVRITADQNITFASFTAYTTAAATSPGFGNIKV